MPSRDLILKILGDSLGAQKALKEAQKDLKETGEHAEKTGQHFGGMAKFAAVAGGAAGVGLLVEGLKGAIEAASDEQTAQAGLDAALKATHQSVKAMSPALEEAAASSRNLGFSDVDTEHALTKLEIATGSTKESIKDLSVAQDIARVKHISLEAASQTLAQAMTGSQRAAKQLGIVVNTTSTNVDELKRSHEDLTTSVGKADLAHAKLMDKMATGQAVIAAVTDKVHGQADAYSQTAAGGMATFKVQMEHLQATIGEKLIPVLTLLLTGLNNSVQFIEQHWPQISGVFDTVMHAVQDAWDKVGRPTFEGVVKVVNAVTDTATTLWRTFGGTITTIVKNDLGAVENVFQGLFTAIKGVFNLIDDLIHGRWSQIWGDMGQIVSGAIQVVTAGLTAAVKNIGAIAELIGGALKDGIVGALKGLGGLIISIIKSDINAIIDVIDAFHIPAIKVLGHQVFGGFDFNIPHLASGGIVNRPTLAMIGEAGPEAVVPLGRGGYGGDLHIHGGTFIGTNLEAAANEIHDALLRKQRTMNLGFKAA